MLTDWEYAHTDHTRGATRPEPAGLAASEADWRARLEQAPNGWLLHSNAMTRTLASGGPIHLMHTTVALDAIRTSGRLYASTGCLAAALYCAPLTPEPAGLRPHNLGGYLLETKPHTRTLVFEIRPQAPVPPLGIDYLRLGGVHLRTYLAHRDLLTPAEDAGLRERAMARIRTAADFLDLLLRNAAGRRTPEAAFVDRLAATIPAFPFLGYLYFEVLSEYLMLHSTHPRTKEYARNGELDNRLYKQLAFAAVDGMDRLFDLSRFRPDHTRLYAIIERIAPELALGAAEYTRQRLSHVFAGTALAPTQDTSTYSFRDADADRLLTETPHLLGQLLFREMRTLDRYPQLYLAFEQAKALQAWTYWNRWRIPTRFHALPKGEIGINPAYPGLDYTVWTAETCARGLLHPVEQLDVTLTPRLADLHLTAMRRDETGRAAGHRLERT
ncbi:hypothetical protein ACFQLX_19695 [Streptomyces polyrhachis]|uniref:Uncharacterized protein n=1 Tax=Streptomyces polyrhachis TaxID=1282885 RepID=A0ABW2GJQ4_9ACTN